MTTAFVFLIAGVFALQQPSEAALGQEQAFRSPEEDYPDPTGRFGVIEGVEVPEPVIPPALSVPSPPTQQAPRPEVQVSESAGRTAEGILWQDAFAPTTWPVWALVLVASCGIGAALWTVALLRRQIRAGSVPRLHLDGIRFTGLVPGSRPVFFVRIGNAGPTDAYKVTVSISAVYQGGGGKAGAPQTMTIPAHGSREFFVRWQNALTSAVRDDILGGSSKLCVKVAVQLGDGEPQKHCYQFHPWDNDRPPGVPDFVPCDLDVQLGGFTTGRASRLATDDVPLIQPRRVEENQPELVLD